MKSTPITIAIGEGQTSELPGYIVSEYVAVTKHRGGRWSLWTITHRPTGYAVRRAEKYREALAMAKMLVDVCRDCAIDLSSDDPKKVGDTLQILSWIRRREPSRKLISSVRDSRIPAEFAETSDGHLVWADHCEELGDVRGALACRSMAGYLNWKQSQETKEVTI